jgi:hypothetical protein
MSWQRRSLSLQEDDGSERAGAAMVETKQRELS